MPNEWRDCIGVPYRSAESTTVIWLGRGAAPTVSASKQHGDVHAARGRGLRSETPEAGSARIAHPPLEVAHRPQARAIVRKTTKAKEI